MRGLRWYITLSGALIILAVVGGYAYFQIWRIKHGTVFFVETPREGETVYEPLMLVAGVARNFPSLSINDRPVSTDESGRFAGKVLLAEGYNVLMVRAKDRFGAVWKETRSVVYKPQEP